ncbi:DUF1488 domain-containing protein [Vibrio sp. DW001]|uniref:DUF1488 domain-containing protein n=1 Tax=Vibrio sp. DW001 TaxID=2912315 RepID=UPI0023AE7429|nr:DUF1488 domain-containing protein [Vibrio sp. DW001]WED26650.1 DUF1488 domain-containing protein [Vibrio sp. DW001]
MNQSILFSDIQEWNDKREVVEFTAQQAGSLIKCTISRQRLTAMSGTIELHSDIILDVFSEYRFDIEEIAEDMIEDERFNDLDQVEII